jgi:hypothetical protein
MARRGRKRKTGPRYPSGDLRRESPRERAATMPHRRALGSQATDQRAECELGRMVLRHELEPLHGQAGEQYAHDWRAYRATLLGPSCLHRSYARSFGCDQCSEKSCMCERLKLRYLNAQAVLLGLGSVMLALVHRVVVNDCALSNRKQILILRVALIALADHYGLGPRLTKRHQGVSWELSHSQRVAPPLP